MPSKKPPARPNARVAQQQRAKKLRPQVLRIRDQIPWVFGDNTYIYAAIAANGGTLRETDIDSTFGQGGTRSVRQRTDDALGLLRRYQIQTRIGRGPSGYALTFDQAFPLAKQAYALARKIGTQHPFPIENNMPSETPPPPPPRNYDLELLAGSEVNTLVMAATRVLRGKVTRAELIASVPHQSYTAVERAVQRLIEYGILDAGGGAIYFAKAPWLPELERLYDAYLGLRPDLSDQIRPRLELKRERRDERPKQNLFGYALEQRVLQTLAVNGPMKRTKLTSETMIARDEIMLKPLANAGIIVLDEQRRSRTNVIVSLNAAFPVYSELRALLLSLAGKPDQEVQDLSTRPSPDGFNVEMIFNTPVLLKALLMINSVQDEELDAASLNRLRPEHPLQVIHGRFHWLEEQGIVTVRVKGLVRYHALNPAYVAYSALKRLLDRIAKVCPELVSAAEFNDDLKPARRLSKTATRGSAKARAAKQSRP